MLRNIFKGCYINNNIPLGEISMNGESCYVINIVNNPNKMGHWVCFYFQNNTLFFFDSFGIHPNFYSGDIALLFNNYLGEKVIVVQNKIQSDRSNVCGGYVIWFINMMVKGKSYRFIRNFFNVNRICNDAFIKRYIFAISRCIFKEHFLDC